MREVIEKEPSLGEPSGVTVQTQGTITGPEAPDSKVTKVIVAVHGVGDQHNFATIQSVVSQFCSLSIPLGSFHTEGAAYLIQPPYAAQQFQHLAFAEVYWAKISREAVSEQHTLEEAKKWARTIVERLRLRWKEGGKCGECMEADFVLLKLVLAEMIQSIAVLERLCYVAERAGLFTFDLRKLLDDYLGDVQIVVEFGLHRRKILDAFVEVMKRVHEAYPKAQIYLVAHSEGTVVSFLGLLEAIRERKTAGWIDSIRGFMTIGSPIDTHLILWPELFESDRPITWPKENEKIEWRNYYDLNDPIGFELDEARAWLNDNGRGGVFNFQQDHDMGFTRYPLPGKAHVDYWNDKEVFGHFIQTVVNKPPSGSSSSQTTGSNHPEPAVVIPCEDAKPALNFNDPPRDIRWKKWLSYCLPYVGVFALLFTAVYVLFKAVTGYLDPKGEVEYANMGFILRSVAGMAVLLFGVTVTTRIPRLTRTLRYRLAACGLYLLSVVLYLWILPPGGWTRLIFATFLVSLVSLICWRRPSWGLKPLLILGTAVVAIIVGYHLYAARGASDVGPLWPVFLATGGFCYLWWLAALMFDLVFVWHVYIRQSLALKRMRAMIGPRARTKTT